MKKIKFINTYTYQAIKNLDKPKYDFLNFQQKH